MNKKALDLLAMQRVCSLSILLPDGTPHAAALHYSHRIKPLTLFFSTDNTSKKAQGLMDGKNKKASVVIGFSEEEWKTIQMDGTVKAILDRNELEEAKEIHYAKNPNSKQFENDPTNLLLSFTPLWWRYTDYNTEPPTIVNSES